MTKENKTIKKHYSSILKKAEWLKESETLLIAKISCDDWLKTASYPHQPAGYTEHRAKTGSHWKLLATKSKPIQASLTVVAAALLKDDLYKLDGHARSIHWESGYLEKPANVIACIYIVDSMQEMIDLYSVIHGGRRFGYENIITACDALDIKLKSVRFKHGLFLEALNIALRGAPRSRQDKRTHKNEIDLNKSLSLFKDELEMLDHLDPPKDVFLTGVIAAGLIMLSIKPDYLEFFRSLSNKEGEIKEGRLNPVEALLSTIDKSRPRKKDSPTQQMDLCKRTVHAILAWEAGSTASGYWMKNALRATDYMPYIREMKRIKGVVKDTDL
ncbi:MAG: hypothetical protein V3U75_08775 [Methylococcaceae bacterium]